MQWVLERRGDAEVTASAPQPPEKIRILVVTSRQQPAVGSDHIGGKQIVAGEAVEAVKPSQAAA